MKVIQDAYPSSSFLGMVKDTSLIMQKILSNQNVLKLLYYNTKDWESKPDLGSAEIKELFANQQISNVPKLLVDKVQRSYLKITYDDFYPNQSNPYYRNNVLEVRVICHFDDWDLGDYELRPYRLAGELDSFLNGARLSGIGVMEFLGATQDIYDDEYAGITIRYLVIRGNEDKVDPLD